MGLLHRDVKLANILLTDADRVGLIVVSALERPVTMISKMTLAKSPARVSLRTPEGKVLASSGNGPEVIVTGNAGELLPFALTRCRSASAEKRDAVAEVKAAERGM